MNMLFGLALALSTFVVVFLAWVLVPKRYKKIIPKEYRPLAALGFVVILIAVIYANLSTYGPRNQLSQTKLPDAPAATEIEPSEEIFMSEDKWESFNEKYKLNKERQEQ